MARTLKWLGLAMLVAATPVAAASALKGVMHAWKADARVTNNMLSGRAAFDQNAVRSALQGYVDDAGRIADQVNGQSADARDIRSRFLQFQADARAALADVSRPPALRADISRVTADCQSCHDAYND